MASALLPLALAAVLQWLDPASVRPQQRGVCVTEWTGGELREIPVEVLGVLDAAGPERTTVLVRLLDDRLAGSGVVAGMSGSPVYVDGKLLGAVAFGWAFAKEPLAGVTPFSAMHNLTEGGGGVTAQAPTLSQLAALAAGRIEPLAVMPQLPPRGDAPLQLAAVGGLPLPSGFSQQLLAGMGLQAIPAGGGPGPVGAPQPGEMAAVLLVWGDATLAAAGTVTARDGERIYAFGHPLFALGSVRLPAARARVLAVQGSYQNPFKLFSVGTSFGTFVTDRPAGMLALVGEPPQGLPVAVTVHDVLGVTTWRFRIAETTILQPLLVTYLANACLTARGANAGESSVRLGLRVRLADGRSASLDQATRGADALARVSAFVGGVIGFLANSPYPHPAIDGVELRLDREETARGAGIVEVLPSRTTVSPGDELELTVKLQPHEAASEQRRLTIKVPATVLPGPLDLVVADGAAWSEYRLKAEGITAADFAGQLAQLGLLESSSTLVAALEGHERGVALPGVSQPALPPSWSATLAVGLGSRTLTRLGTAVVATSRLSAPYPLEGAFRIPLTVRARLETP